MGEFKWKWYWMSFIQHYLKEWYHFESKYLLGTLSFFPISKKTFSRFADTIFFFWEHSILFTQDWMRTFTFRMKYCILNAKMLRVKNSHFCTKCKNHIMIVHFINTNDSFALDAINHSNKNRTVKFGFSKELVYFYSNITRKT